MTRRRPVPGFSVSTKGHSVLRKYAYSTPPSPGRVYGTYGGYDTSPVRSRYYSGEEDYINSAVRRATSVGADALYENMDSANLSRNKDYDLLSHTNAAIVNSETHSSPRAAVASLRARSRPQALPVSARNVSPRRQIYHHQAAIVASKLEDEPTTRRRRAPRSKYAADKYRATHKVGENPLYYGDTSTTGLTASRGTIQKTTDRRAIRDSEGNFTKPRNILSWQKY